MIGIRKRVTVGFLSIVCLLFVSGIISFYELSQLSSSMGDILKANKRNVELASTMLDAVDRQNLAIINLSVLKDRSYDSLCRANMEQLEDALLIAQNEAVDKTFLDSLAFATTEMRLVTDNYMAFTSGMMADSLNSDWYNNEYKPIYAQLTSAIRSYMTLTQNTLVPHAEQMKTNAYRAVTPVLISLAVMIATVLMLFYFMTIYCVNPVIRMNKSLGDYLLFKIPFGAKMDCNDEMLELKDKIEALINLSKQSKA